MKNSSAVKIIKEANLSMNHFSKLIGVGGGTVSRYLTHGNIKPETIRKIAAGLVAIKETNLVWPDIHYVPNNTKIEKQYTKNKKKSAAVDKKFATAYKKALKKVNV